MKLAPEYILSFGPDGMSAHWDHITVGKVAFRIAKTLKIPMAAFTISPQFMKQGRLEGFLKRRKFGKYKGIPKHRPGDMKIKVDMGVKRKAMKSHASQFGTSGPLSNLSKAAAQKTFGYEFFVRERI